MHGSNEISLRTSREDNVHETEVQTGDNIKVYLIQTVCYSVVWTGSVFDLITHFLTVKIFLPHKKA